MVTVAYLSQCLPFRLEDVTHEDTYPFVAQRYVEAARPGVRLSTTIHPYTYPYVDLELKEDLALRDRPDVVVLEIPAGPVARRREPPVDLRRFPTRVRTGWQRIQHLRELRVKLQLSPVTDRVVQVADIGLRAVVNGPLRRITRRFPMPTVSEYESLVEAAIGRLQAKTSATLVLIGPGGFTESGGGDGCADDARKLYDVVNEMTRRIAERRHLLFVDRVALAAEAERSFFLPGASIYYSPEGHRTFGRFLGHELVTGGVV